MQRSRRAGVQIGLHVPGAFGAARLTSDEILARCARLGIGAVEIDVRAVEAALGAPAEPAMLHPPELSFETGLLPIEEDVLREAVDLGRRTFAAHVRAWRTSVSLAPLDTLRHQYEDAGVRIEIIKWNDLPRLADDEIDYGFRLAQALGASAVATELSPTGPTRVGPFADRHQLFVGFHGGETTSAQELSAALNVAPFNGATIDLGRWVAGGNGSPLPFLAQHADRVTHVHLSDRRASDGAKTWFGQGDAPIREVLQAMRDHDWSFPATIDIEYDLATDADQMTEIARAIAYCRSCLDA